MERLLDLDATTKYRTPFGPTRECDSDEDEFNGLDQFGCPIPDPKPEKPAYETCVSFIHKSVKLLLGCGDWGIADSEGQTPIYKTDNKHLVKLILAHGVEVNMVDSCSNTTACHDIRSIKNYGWGNPIAIGPWSRSHCKECR